ncbi:MAG: ATP-dependent protease [Deltaproteobacteria bacterium]|nr:MAG: ATP-dependent protease [Deltaproteobacteria bacterium]
MASQRRNEAEITPEGLAHLPIFPLPRAVLFPGVVLPLHLFEPRYRALAQHAVASDRLIALAALKPGFEMDYLGRPPVYPIMGLGRVVAEQRLADGRWNIALRGLCRIEMLEERPPDAPFRVIRAQRLDERERYGDRVAADRLRDLILQLTLRLPELRAELGPLLSETRPPGRLADVAAGLLVDDFGPRQRLLEETNVAARLERVEELLVDALLDAAVARQEPGPKH